MEMLELKKQMQAASAPHVRGIGEILLYLGQQNEQIAELIEQDLANREMSINACGKVLYDYAKKHQKGGSWACAVFEMNPDNPVIKLILNFTKSQALGWKAFGRSAQILRWRYCRWRTRKNPRLKSST